LRDQAANLGERAKEQTHIGQELAQSRLDLAGLRSKLSHLEEGIPDAAYVPTMLKEIEMTGKQMGVEVMGLRPQVKPKNMNPDKVQVSKKPYEPLDLDLKGRATYRDLVQFVTSLNTFPKIVEVRTIGITPPAAGQRGTDSRLEFTLGIRAFLFSQKQDSAKPIIEEKTT
jgi:Tfp pilus assembly protein PilO